MQATDSCNDSVMLHNSSPIVVYLAFFCYFYLGLLLIEMKTQPPLCSVEVGLMMGSFWKQTYYTYAAIESTHWSDTILQLFGPKNNSLWCSVSLWNSWVQLRKTATITSVFIQHKGRSFLQTSLSQYSWESTDSWSTLPLLVTLEGGGEQEAPMSSFLISPFLIFLVSIQMQVREI